MGSASAPGASLPRASDRALPVEPPAVPWQWRAMVQAAPGGMALVGLDGSFLSVNGVLCWLLRSTEAELLARSLPEIVHPDDLVRHLGLLTQLLRGDCEQYSLEQRCLTDAGSAVWLSCSVGLVREPGTDQPAYLVAQVHDIPEAQRAARRLSSVIASATDAFIAIDGDGRVSEWNRAAERIFGWAAHEAVGAYLDELIVPLEDRGAHRAGLARLVAGGVPRILDRPVQRDAMRRDGSRLPVELTVWRVPDGPGQFYGFVRDISLRVAAEQAAQAATARQAAIIEAQLAIAAVELSPQKVLTEICTRAMSLTGATGAAVELPEEQDLVVRAVARGSDGAHLGLRLPLGDSISGLALSQRRPLLCEDSDTDQRVDAAACRKVGVKSMIVTPLLHGSEVVGVLKVVSPRPRQFTAQDQLALELLAAPFGAAISNAGRLQTTYQQATTDPVTGLGNRSHVLHELDLALQRQHRHGGHVAVIFLDLDRFKAVNDQFGHATGDELLHAVGGRLREVLRPADAAGRFGGDEFVVICEALTSPAEAHHLGERLISGLSGSYQLTQGQVRIGVSVGIALTAGGTAAGALLRAADRAMYQAKHDGGSRHVVHNISPD